MPRRIEAEAERARLEAVPVAHDPAALPLDPDLEIPALPRELPPWARDAVAISQRAREMLARLAPVVLHVLTFWDHRARSASVAGRRVSIDASGSYRAGPSAASAQ